MSEVQQLEQHLVKSKKLVAEMLMAEKLQKNTEFRKLILEEFCVQECARYAQISADPALPANERADALALAQAAGHLRRWLGVKCQMGYVAERELPQVEEAIAAARAEEEGEANQ